MGDHRRGGWDPPVVWMVCVTVFAVLAILLFGLVYIFGGPREVAKPLPVPDGNLSTPWYDAPPFNPYTVSEVQLLADARELAPLPPPQDSLLLVVVRAQPEPDASRVRAALDRALPGLTPDQDASLTALILRYLIEKETS